MGCGHWQAYPHPIGTYGLGLERSLQSGRDDPGKCESGRDGAVVGRPHRRISPDACRAYAGCPEMVAFSPDVTTLASGSRDGRCQLGSKEEHLESIDDKIRVMAESVTEIQDELDLDTSVIEDEIL